MVRKVNSYLAALIITVFGSAAALLIVHIANRNAATITQGDQEGNYAALQRSILNAAPGTGGN